MDSNDERSIVPVNSDWIVGGYHAQGNNVAPVLNSSNSTVKIDSLSIELGIVKEKGDAQKCSHFSIRGYAARMRGIGGSNFLPCAKQLPPIDVPRFRYWLCQRCLRNNGTTNTSHETALVPFCDQSVVQPCARPCPPQGRDGVTLLPFGEGTSGVKPVDSRNDDESILVTLAADESHSSQEIPANAIVLEELTKDCSIDTNVDSPGKKDQSNDLRDNENPQQATTSLVAKPIQSGQQNDYPSGHPRRKARKVRLLKELLCGNTERQKQKKEKSPLGLVPKASSPLEASSQIKRKIMHDQDQRPVDITSKKAKAFKGNAVAKTSVVEPSRDSGGQKIDKYQWNKHGTQRSSIVVKVGSDPMTAWRSIFSDMGRADNQVAATSGFARSIHDLSKGRGTVPYSNLMPPPRSGKKINTSKKIPKNHLRSKFFGEDLQRTNVGGSRMKDRQSDMELGLGLSLNYESQAQFRSLPLIPNQTPSQDLTRKGSFFLGESNVAHRIHSYSKSKEGSVREVSDKHVPRTTHVPDPRHYKQLSHGSCSGHHKLDFSDPHSKRNSGIRGYSDVMRSNNHQRQEKMFAIGRSDEREIVELMAKNQYERSLCEARNYYPPGASNNNGIPNTSGFLKVHYNEVMPTPHREYPSMIRPSSSFASISMMPTSEMRNTSTGFFHQEQAPAFTMFDSFSQHQNKPSNGIRISDSGLQRHHNSHYHHVSNGNNKIPHNHLYTPTNMQVLEAFNRYHNGTLQNEAYVPTSMAFGQTLGSCSNKNKGKNIIDLDLNVVAPNVLEEQNDLESLDWMSTDHHPYLTKDKKMEMNQKNICSLDSSYSNEAIPAMQLLSLMDAGKSSLPFSIDGRKFITKPFSPCYNHGGSTMTGRVNSMSNSHFPYSGMRPGVQATPSSSSSLGIGGSFPYAYRTDQNVNLPPMPGHQVYEKPQEVKSRNTSSTSRSHGCRPEDSFVFPLPWHSIEGQSERFSLGAQVSYGSRSDPSGTEICTINQNPADFSIPGPENTYMINVEDLIFRGESSYKGKSTLENANGPKKQKRL